MLDPETLALAESVLSLCRARGWQVATAESCTGGLVAAALTAVAGSSDVVDRGFVTYSNAAKAEMLGVAPALIEAHGAVSEIVARAMAEGATLRSKASLSVAVTGVAGPGGATAGKPVGLVHFAAGLSGGRTIHVERRFGDIGRDAVRARSTVQALKLLLQLADE